MWRPILGALADVRLWLLLLPAIAILSVNLPVALTFGYSMAAMLVVAAVSHLTRRVLFPYLDLETVARGAALSSLGAGMVFLGVCIVLASMVIGSAIWMGK